MLEHISSSPFAEPATAVGTSARPLDWRQLAERMLAPPVDISPPQCTSNEGSPQHRPVPTAVHTPPALQLQLQVAMRALVDVLNHSDEALQAGVIRELEQRTGLTVRTVGQEEALRQV